MSNEAMNRLLRRAARGDRPPSPAPVPLTERAMTMDEATAVFVGRAHLEAGILVPGPPPAETGIFGAGAVGTSAVEPPQKGMNELMRRAGELQRSRKAGY